MNPPGPTGEELFGTLATHMRDLCEPPTASPVERLADLWARSGAMALTGRPNRPLIAPPRVVLGAIAAGDWLHRAAAAAGAEVTVDSLALLGEHAALEDLQRHGQHSCGGATRLLRAVDGWMAICLSRAQDRDDVPAWLGVDGHPSGWDEVADTVRGRSGSELVRRARLLGMAAAVLDGPVAGAGVQARRVDGLGTPPPPISDLTVIDLSSLWAGPLAGHLLQLSGARVIKVESTARPDGAREGGRRFFDLLHGGQESVTLNFDSARDREALELLLMGADIVIEASRPRALRQLGIDTQRIMTVGRPRVWLTITGHGTSGATADWVGFGDDAAVAGGLAARDGDDPCFCADAVADPLSGIVSAAAVLGALRSGRWHLDVALARVAAAMAGPTAAAPWASGDPDRAMAPVARTPVGATAAFGHHTEAVIKEFERRSRRRISN